MARARTEPKKKNRFTNHPQIAKYRKKSSKARPIAIACSDIHLSHTPPISRSAEKDWYEVQQRYMDEIKDLCDNHGVPLLIGGDLFHNPDPPPSLINLAIQHLPETVYAVAGQHDLFHHNPNSFGETAYGTLVLSGRITHVPPDGVQGLFFTNAVIYGQSWEQNLNLPERPFSDEPFLQILLSHKFCYWPGDPPFPGVDDNETAWDYGEELAGYGFNVAFFGDHHQDFIYHRDGFPTIVNCGSVLLRSINEKVRTPKVYELLEDGSVNAISLKSVEQDVWLDESDIGVKIHPSEVSQFVHALREIQGGELLSFEGAVMDYMRRKKLPETVRVLLLKAIGRFET